MKKSSIIAGLLLTAGAMSAAVTEQAAMEYASFNVKDIDTQVGASANTRINMHVTYPEGFEYRTFYVFSREYDPTGRWVGDAVREFSFNWYEDTCFFCLDGVYNGLPYILISPDVEVTGTTDVHLDFNDCVNFIEGQPVLSDGSDALGEVLNNRGEVVNEGNIERGWAATVISRKGNSMLVLSNLTIFGLNGDSSTLSKGWGGIMINDIGDEYEVLLNQYFDIVATGEYASVFQSVNGADVRGELFLRNNPDDYVSMAADYTNPVPGPYDVTDTDWYQITTTYSYDGLWSDTGGGRYTTSMPAQDHFLINQNLCEGNRIQPVFTIAKCVSDNGGVAETRNFYPIMSPRFQLSGSKAVFQPNHTDDFFSFFHISIPEEGVPFFLYRPYPVHPRFGWEWDFANEEVPHFGNTTPCITVASLWNSIYAGSVMEIYNIGRLGDIRLCDDEIAWAIAKRNDEIVFEGSISELYAWSGMEFPKARPSGKYVFTIENDNAMVDDMPSLNTTVISVDASKPDHEPPSLTMVTFRDGEDRINDHFKTPGEGVLEFTAVDFSSAINSYGLPYLSALPLESVKVEYSPMGEDKFKELAVEEIPDLYYMPEFGYFFRGSLASVTDYSENGWFTLRFTVADGMGNTQVQTLEPAFKIDSAMTAVEEITDDSGLSITSEGVTACGEILIYDSMGRIVRRGEGNVSTIGLSGVHVVKTGITTTKIIL